MTNWLLDTNVVSELRKPNPSKTLLGWLRSVGSEKLFLSSITFAEIRFGIELQSEPDLRSRLLIWLDTIIRPMFEERTVSITEDVLLEWRIMGEILSRKRRTVPEPDFLLCATARHYRMNLASRDIKHLGITGVPVLNPWTGESFNGA
jgi:toxin FitB